MSVPDSPVQGRAERLTESLEDLRKEIFQAIVEAIPKEDLVDAALGPSSRDSQANDPIVYPLEDCWVMLPWADDESLAGRVLAIYLDTLGSLESAMFYGAAHTGEEGEGYLPSLDVVDLLEVLRCLEEQYKPGGSMPFNEWHERWAKEQE